MDPMPSEQESNVAFYMYSSWEERGCVLDVQLEDFEIRIENVRVYSVEAV
jgi:hypothetical protein